MKRREFITLLSATAAAWPLTARAQQAVNKYTVGILSAGEENPTLSTVLVAALREFGWIEG